MRALNGNRAAAIYLLSWCIACGERTATADPALAARVNVLVAQLDRGELERVEIFEVPAAVMTRMAITPQRLEEISDYRLTIRDVRVYGLSESLSKALRSMKATRRSAPGDVRWGLVFYGADKSRRGAIYLDGTGDTGFIDEMSVEIKSDILTWLTEIIGSRLR